jgi:pyridoxal phosphate enzyme (YggS family)
MKKGLGKDMGYIKDNVSQVLNSLPQGIEVVAAIKGRRVEEVLEAIGAGVKIIGANYVQEAEAFYNQIERRVSWHFIGKLQKNKAKKAVRIFDMIETLDSVELAYEIDKISLKENKKMQVLIEINSGREEQKSGIMPESLEQFIKKLAGFQNIDIMGLMTMGPEVKNPEDIRQYFRETKELFEKIRVLNLPYAQVKYLSMGMSGSYNIAMQEGANIIRIGTGIFGERQA